MADSVDSTSVHGASDEVTDSFCDPCFKEGTNQSAAGYCPKCVEFYCHSCLATHRRMTATEHHKVLLGSDMPTCQADKPVKYQLCDKHDGEGKDRYCFDHGTTICGICYIREHKQCQVKEVSEACWSFNMSAEKAAFSTDVGMLVKHVKETSQSIKSNKARLEKKKQGILTDAQKQRDDLLEKVNQSHQNFSGEVTRLFEDHITTLSARQSALDEIITKVETIVKSLQQSGTSKQTDAKEFLELYYSAEKVRLLEDKIKLLSQKQIDINCFLNGSIQPLIGTKSKFGEFSLQTSAFQYRTEHPNIHYPYKVPRKDPQKTTPGSGAMRAVQSVKLAPLQKMKVKIPKDKKDCTISGIDFTVDGNMMLADFSNRKAKLFSPNGILLSFLKLPESPKSVAVINKSEAALSMINNQICITNIADSSQIALQHIITRQEIVGKITAYKNNLILICDTSPESRRSVRMINLSGKVLWTRTTDSVGKNLWEWATFLTSCSGYHGDTVIVTDQPKGTITVLEAGTGKVVKVNNVKGKEPHGVAVDDNGNVFVSYKSGEIALWSRGMQKETRLISGSEYLKNPWGMAYDRKRAELAVISKADLPDYCNFIYRFKILVV